ncbi:AraC family transcriptional regulator [Sediminicola sp. YIK13]|uniref:GyrI-like domain-containing protein n=1 Tax=Sediminicola sp. YIK13 TaxID=1453352 RepID=UPI000722D2B0|nr:GyrI-like domain-containing protein [Sediminicola sp. YIK13]ALM07297.1 AraC family transcriptional regulator [Sediminicola sp. YIK13]
MEVRITTIKPKTLVGKRLSMSLDNNRTVALWQSFMPFKKVIRNKTSNEVISLQDYKGSLNLQNFSTSTEFEKWAAVEVSCTMGIPDNLEVFLLAGGSYAVFKHIGDASTFHNTLAHIFEVWLPNSIYSLDNRPHFEVMGDNYKNNDPNSEEEVWIPIKKI